MAGGRRDGVGMVAVLHSEVEWEWVTSSAVVTDQGSGLMDLPPQRPGDRGRDTYRARQRGRSEQPANRRGRRRHDTRPQQNTSPSRGTAYLSRLRRVTARKA